MTHCTFYYFRCLLNIPQFYTLVLKINHPFYGKWLINTTHAMETSMMVGGSNKYKHGKKKLSNAGNYPDRITVDENVIFSAMDVYFTYSFT